MSHSCASIKNIKLNLLEIFMLAVHRWPNVGPTLFTQRQRYANGTIVGPTLGQRRLAIWDATMQLQGSLACTDWGVFAPDSVNLNEHASIITDYITFCMDSTIPMKTVTVYCNSKPWITSDVNNTLKKKLIAFRSKDIHTMKNAHRQLQTEISQAKQRYREKVENEFSCMNTKQAVWADYLSFQLLIH